MLLHYRRRVRVVLMRVLTEVPGWVAVGMWFAFQVISSFQVLGGSGGGVAYGAHIGGFLAGLALAKPFTFGRPVRHLKRETPESYGRPGQW
jgi:membrane associated rhomboid family serine protease